MSLKNSNSTEPTNGAITSQRESMRMLITRFYGCHDSVRQKDWVPQTRLSILKRIREKKEVKIIDVAILGDARVCEKELEKIDNYKPLKDEIARLWKMWRVTVIPIIVGTLGAITRFEKCVKEVTIKMRVEHHHHHHHHRNHYHHHHHHHISSWTTIDLTCYTIKRKMSAKSLISRVRLTEKWSKEKKAKREKYIRGSQKRTSKTKPKECQESSYNTNHRRSSWNAEQKVWKIC